MGALSAVNHLCCCLHSDSAIVFPNLVGLLCDCYIGQRVQCFQSDSAIVSDSGGFSDSATVSDSGGFSASTAIC